MSDQDLSYVKSLETVANTYPPAKGFCGPDSVNGTTADKVIIAQNNLIIELLLQIQKLLVHTISSNTVSTSTLENLHQSFQALTVSAPSASIKPPPRKFVVQTDPQELINQYKSHHSNNDKQ